VALLHGLAGYAGEWMQTASWLVPERHVVALEQRGHGRSERTPGDVSRRAFVDDAAAWLEETGIAPAVVVGQSLGGHTAFLLAAERPELVDRLVVVEATPEAAPDAPEAVRRWLDRWPVPFPSRDAALAYFGGDTLWARTWAAGLEEREHGLWPAFERDVMLAAVDETSRRSYWDDWAAVRCPTLVVRAEQADGREAYARMLELLPQTSLVEIAEAGHDLHLDQPGEWRGALEGFLEGS